MLGRGPAILGAPLAAGLCRAEREAGASLSSRQRVPGAMADPEASLARAAAEEEPPGLISDDESHYTDPAIDDDSDSSGAPELAAESNSEGAPAAACRCRLGTCRRAVRAPSTSVLLLKPLPCATVVQKATARGAAAAIAHPGCR